MNKYVRWDDVKWRSSVRAIVSVLKYHSLLVLSILLLNILLTNLTGFIVSYNRRVLINFWDLLLNIVPSYLFIVIFLLINHISFKGIFISTVCIEACVYLSCIFMFCCILVTANIFVRLELTKFRLIFIFTSVILHQLKSRRQHYGVCKLLDKQNLSVPFFASYLLIGLFHSLLSLMLSYVLWFITTFLQTVISHYSFYNISNNFLFTFADRMQGFISKFPSLSHRPARFSWLLQHLELVIAVSWITVLIEVYIDLMNYDSTHLDALIANSLDEMPVHNTVSFEDEMLLARALYNYSKGVSYILNNKLRYTSCPPSLNVIHEDNDIRRSGMEPYSKITSKNGYLMESKKIRYQVDEVVYRMLIESSGRLWRTYVNACLETLSEVEINIHHLVTSPFSDKNKLKINAYNKFTNYSGPLNLRSFFCNIIPQFSTQVTRHALNLLLLSILYLRGITSWLCIANMLGYDNINVKHVARDIIVQILNIHNVLSGLNRTSIPQYIQDYIRVLNSDINNTLKCLSVYTETLLYSKFDTSFETYRILEHLYSNRNLIL